MSLGKSGSIAFDVIAALGDRLPSYLREPRQLVGMVDVQATGNTTLIQIQVTANSPEIATLITNAWAAAFVNRANSAFAKTTQRPELSAELDQARLKYDEQQQLLASSQLPGDVMRLERQTTDLATLMSSVRLAQLQVITDTLKLQAAQQSTFLGLSSTALLTNKTDALVAARQTGVERLREHYSRLNRLLLLRESTLGFQQQLKDGSAAGSSLAYLLLKAELFAEPSEAGPTIQFQAQSSDVPTVDDLNALVATIDTQIQNTRATIATLSTTLQTQISPDDLLATTPSTALGQLKSQAFDMTGLLDTLVVSQTGQLVGDARLQALERQNQALLTELEQKRGQLFVLLNERNLAKANYSSIAARLTEVQAANAGDDTVVRLAGVGVITGVSRHTAKNTLLATLLALLLSTAVVVARGLVLHWRSPTVRSPARPSA